MAVKWVESGSRGGSIWGPEFLAMFSTTLKINIGSILDSNGSSHFFFVGFYRNPDCVQLTDNVMKRSISPSKRTFQIQRGPKSQLPSFAPQVFFSLFIYCLMFYQLTNFLTQVTTIVSFHRETSAAHTCVHYSFSSSSNRM